MNADQTRSQSALKAVNDNLLKIVTYFDSMCEFPDLFDVIGVNPRSSAVNGF